MQTINTPSYNFTERELAQRWNISIKTLQRWRNIGEGPKFIKLGKAVRYPTTEVEKHEQNNLCQSTSIA